ncbi:MAG: hypothetical protein GY847_03400, partial [Proteobacteria bacterium]|nr:hypothetical protein [Pseudomonadota bacterium]
MANSGSYASATSGGVPEARNSEEAVVNGQQNGDFVENEEPIENLSAEMQARRAYVNISRNNLQDYSVSSFAQRLIRDNKQRQIPFPKSVAKEGWAFRLGYANQADRDGAALVGIVIDSVVVEVEAPPPPPPPRTTYKQTIYIFGVPEEESDARVANFLQKNGLHVTSDFRKLYIPDTVLPGLLPNGIWNGGRSVVVEASIGTRIPTFTQYTSPTLKFA